MTSLLLALLGLSLAHPAVAAPDAIVVLRAHDGKITLWTAALRGSQRSCSVTGAGPKIQPEKTEKPSAALCAELFSLLPKVRSELNAAKPGGPQQHLIDEPQYELRMGARAMPVAFKTDRTCELAEDGSLKCKDNQLTSAQQLMLELRSYGKSMSGPASHP